MESISTADPMRLSANALPLSNPTHGEEDSVNQHRYV